ncbi:hypothetical protein XM38_014940 [Halomicronema hongdechloris C2206]|uniref:Helicase Lhr-like winged helix domain-containing protein n=1 Tax=Halomicronema hongdechloris C2206 TaxID=1641165 RepID=A0A1Z3HJQ3_9CYAN|nr:hypothetical protein [Halomicronema hongdechloris]ASC70554.1 hypothetical protein XM38_014940 [Halomicronema hongdechloris C2206]
MRGQELEITAFRQGLETGTIECRPPRQCPYDVLVQHLVTLACGDGFAPETTLQTLRQTIAYADLSDADFQWVLDFSLAGGATLCPAVE